MKKLLAFIMTFAIMLMATGTAAFASSGSETTPTPTPTSGTEDTVRGSITISNAVVGQTYSIYRIFDLESFNSTSGAYSYKLNEKWNDFFDIDKEGNAGPGTKYVNITKIQDPDDPSKTISYVTWREEADVAAFANLAQKHATNSNPKIDNDGTQLATLPEESEPAQIMEIKFDNLPLGYYLVDTSIGALCSLDTTDPDAKITEKNEVPVVKKEVQEGEEWYERNDASIGDTVNFKTTITVKSGAQNYVLHDEMSAGLTFDINSIKVKLNGDVTNPTITDENDKVITYYTVSITTPDDPTLGQEFDVTFTDAFLNIVGVNNTITVEYSATVNENAVIGCDGNPNKVTLNYGDNKSLTSTTTTYVWGVDIFKFTNTKNNEGQDIQEGLAGAVFSLTTDEKGDNIIHFNPKDNNFYNVCKSTVENCITKIETKEGGAFTLSGLDSGIYYLHEIKAPDGYNKLSGPITITISDDGIVNKNDNGIGVDEVKVENKTGSELPETGGIGTTIFYITGGLLMFGSVILLVTKKKMSVNKE